MPSIQTSTIPSATLIARQPERWVNAGELGGLVRVLSEQIARWPGQEITLYTRDALAGCAALLAAWQCGKTVHLPGDAAQVARLPHPLVSDLPEYQGELAWPDAVDASELVLPHAQARLLVYTSGSSGEPKAIAKSWQQLHTEALALEQVFGAQLGQSLVVATVSHQHLYGLLFRLVWPLVTGRAFASEMAFFPEQLFAASQWHADVVWVGSPAHYQRLGDHLPWDEVRPRLRQLFSSAGPLPESTASTMQQLSGLRPAEVFGSSESGGIAWRQGGARWQCLPGVTVACDHDGALQVRSEHLPHNGWERLEDRIVLHADGQFEHQGRLDRIVKLEGKRIALPQVEQLLHALPQIAEAAVFAEQTGQRQQLCAAVVLRAEAQLALEQIGRAALIRQLQQALHHELESVAVPKRWRFCTSLPRNPQGKVTMSALQALFNEAAAPRQPELIATEGDAQQARFSLHVPTDCAYFAGHFPDAPILPGVTQLHWAAQFGQQHFGIRGQFQRMEAVKFQQVVQPGDELTLQLDWDATRQRLAFSYQSSRGPHASGRLLFTAE